MSFEVETTNCESFTVSPVSVRRPEGSLSVMSLVVDSPAFTGTGTVTADKPVKKTRTLAVPAGTPPIT